VPSGKLIGEETFSIVSDYIGRPIQSYNEQGELIWQTDYDIYGALRNLKGEKQFIPFRQLGQYEDEELEGGMYNRYRYYDSNTGVYWSQDPIRLHGGDNLYAYVRDSNSWVDVFGLTPFVPKPVDSGSVFRGVKPGQPAFSPSAADLAGADHMPGISSKPKNNAQTQKFFDKMGADVKEIDVSKLSSLEAIQDGKDHVSLKPSEKYLADNNLTMKEALEDWSKGGDQHNLSKELAAACK
jgi:RHS repeat-associated protein